MEKASNYKHVLIYKPVRRGTGTDAKRCRVERAKGGPAREENAKELMIVADSAKPEASMNTYPSKVFKLARLDCIYVEVPW